MRTASTPSILGLALAATALLGVAAARQAPGAFDTREVRRVQAHLAGAERLLLERDVSALTRAQRAARARLIRDLRAYRERGAFPANRDFPGERRPYFVDASGTRCAMAHLIERHGGEAIVSRVAGSNNNAYVRELASDGELVAWLDRNGLTVAEAARIQPAYDPPPYIPTIEPRDAPVDHSVLIGTALWAESVGILTNLRRAPTPGKRAGQVMLGTLGGVVGIATGIYEMSDATGSQGWGAACLGLAGLSLGLSIRNAAPAAAPKTEPAIIEAGLWRSPDGAPGFAVRARF